jgi:hypothetical protein
MKRILKRLRRKFSQPSSYIAMDQPRRAVSVNHDNLEQDDYAVETSYGAAAPNRIDSQGMDIPMPDIYGDAHVDIEADLKALDQPTPDIEEPDGFNPYDTAVLHKK